MGILGDMVCHVMYWDSAINQASEACVKVDSDCQNGLS